jgi:putative ABC transport system ATP-binding protein
MDEAARTAPTHDDLVRATGVVKRYHTEAEDLRVLDGLDVTIRAGEFLAITGRSGSGKTTLLNCLSGLDDIDEGSIEFNGIDFAQADDAQRTAQRSEMMSFVFQASDLLPVFTALDNAAMPMVLAGVPTREARERATAALDRVGLSGRMDHYPHQLSGGEQQRVAIARAFAKQPAIVWADEPTGNLDVHTARSMIELLRELHGDGVTLVLVTHDLELADLADRHLEVLDGRLATETLA